MFLPEHVTGQFQTFVSSVTMLDGSFLASYILSMLEGVPQCCPVMDVLIDQMLKGLPFLHLTLWLLRDMCCPDKGSLPHPVRQWWGNFSINNRGLPAMLERIGRLVCSRVYTKNAISAPKLANF